jgi:transglutaminase/protease-like cytokinesis protein 3
MTTYEVQLLQDRRWEVVFSCYDQYRSEQVMVELQNKTTSGEQYRLVENNTN